MGRPGKRLRGRAVGTGQEAAGSGPGGVRPVLGGAGCSVLVVVVVGGGGCGCCCGGER